MRDGLTFADAYRAWIAAKPDPDDYTDAWTRNSKPTVKIYNDGLLIVDVTNRTVTQSGEAVQLTPTEFRLLAALVTHPQQLLSVDQLLRLAWLDESEVGPERVKFTMCRLRKKLGWKDSAPVEAVRGFGYRFTPRKDE